MLARSGWEEECLKVRPAYRCACRVCWSAR